jgi:DNA-binding MarR family transcriptional regulator
MIDCMAPYYRLICTLPSVMIVCRINEEVAMSAVVKHVRSYLHETLGVVLHSRLWRGGNRLPFFLQDEYRFFEMSLLEIPVLLMEDCAERERPAAMVRRHMALVRDMWSGEVVYVRERISSSTRKRLIQHKVPFVVPGNQMYLPMLGLDLRDHFRRLHTAPSRLSPSAQVLLIHLLLRKIWQEKETTSAIAGCLDYSLQTMTRAFGELQDAELAEVLRESRSRSIRLTGAREDVWMKAQEILRSPVRRRVNVEFDSSVKRALRAGLSALTFYSELAAPANPVIAMSMKQWRQWKQSHSVVELLARDPDAVEIEVWSYAPALSAEDGVIDPLSLYLSLRGTQDARVEMALDRMMEGFWHGGRTGSVPKAF